MIDTISTGFTNQSARRGGRTIWFGFLFFAAVTCATIVATIAGTNHRAAREVCELIRDNYFRSGEAEVRAFVSRCLSEAASEPYTLSKHDAIKRINRRLSGLKTSHLSVYTPTQNRQIWVNAGLDTGIRARRIDGEIVVFRLLPSSPAQKAGVKVGDAIALVNGEPSDEDDVASTPGRYRIARGHEFVDLDIDVDDLTEHLGPTLDVREDGIGILRIGSFLAHYFDGEQWPSVVRRMQGLRGVVIDVRGNAGGSFPAGLRALSPFFCKPTVVGDLWTTAEGAGAEGPGDLKDDLDTSSQVAAFRAYGLIHLRSFEGYGCFKGSVTVLMDDRTSSVAEIFAEAFTLREKSRVWGVPTAGQVVAARWFAIGSLGGGDFSISIPVAGYRTTKWRELEHNGVDPQRILVYDLEKALHGRDNWIEEGVRSVSF